MNIQRAKNNYLWWAIAHVQPQIPGDLLDGAAGAHVPVFGHGKDDGDFIRAATRLMIALEFDVVEIDEVEQLSVREFRKRASEDMCQVAKELNDVAPVGYGTFYTYPETAEPGPEKWRSAPRLQ